MTVRCTVKRITYQSLNRKRKTLVTFFLTLITVWLQKTAFLHQAMMARLGAQVKEILKILVITLATRMGGTRNYEMWEMALSLSRIPSASDFYIEVHFSLHGSNS